MNALPDGTITFLFTDVEGSSRLWEANAGAMAPALARQEAILRRVIDSCLGYVFSLRGDGIGAAFATAPSALEAALDAQRALQAEPWDPAAALRVRIALHTGTAEARDGDYYGPTLNRVARLLETGHGGQTLLSAATQELVRDSLPDGAALRPLGDVRLKDLARPERVFQLLHPDLAADFPPLRSLDSIPNNLPQQVTSFIGREKESAQIRQRLGGSRLVTLTGAGGSGKTRLALQTAAEMLDEETDGVWLVELASLSDPAAVPQAVAAALGVRELAGLPLTETLVSFLRDKNLLLLLDNCEHLLPACAGLVEALLRACPAVRVLATSRERLNVAGEQGFPVSSLSVPNPRRSEPLETLTQYEAVRLFIDRAVAAEPGFAVDSANAPAVAQVCHRLDGIPLALELAAARVRFLSVAQIARRLDDRFRLLTGGSRTALPRHRTLRAAVDWSYEMLDARERAMLRRLSVFAGGAVLEAVEAVCVDEGLDAGSVLDVLSGLVDKSLVLFDLSAAGPRYQMLDTVRHYSREKLTESGEETATRERHRDWSLRLAEDAEPRLSGPELVTWLARLEAEHDNLRAAIDGCRWEPAGIEAGLRLTGALGRFWSLRSHFSEGRRLLAGALAASEGTEPSAARAKALNAAGDLAYSQGDYDAARALVEESVALSRRLGDRTRTAASLGSLGNIAHAQAEYDAARRFHEESLSLERSLGNERGVARSFNNLGLVAYARHDYDAAWDLLSASLDLERRLGNEGGMANSLNNLGLVAFDRGDYDAAGMVHRESLMIETRLGNKRGIADSLEGMASLAQAQGQARRAARLYGAMDALRQEIGCPPLPQDVPDYSRRVSAVHSSLGDQEFASAWAEGLAMSLDDAVASALADAE